MPEAVLAIPALFGEGAAVATAAEAAGAGLGVGAATGAAAGTAGLGTAVATAAGTALATGAVNKLLQGKPPGLPGPTEMPDPEAQAAARQKSLVDQIARRGRASTILTDGGGGGTAVGGSGKLGG